MTTRTAMAAAVVAASVLGLRAQSGPLQTTSKTPGIPPGGIVLAAAAAVATLSSDTPWTLAKTGELNAAAGTVTWTLEATQEPTAAEHLRVHGVLTMTNTGNGPATIGNIVVNLQTKQGNTWVTRSSDIANASDGDAATTATIQRAASSEEKPTFSENGASGSLNFMDAVNNTLFSLTPQVTLGAGQTQPLLFSAEFDNTNAALRLAPRTPFRAEVIVSFGNANANGNSAANLDINGNGAIDADEAHVRSVPARLTLTVPTATDTSVTLTDALADVTATGDVSFSNVVFDLGPTSGTVTANVSGGASGGSITNCAHLTGAAPTVSAGGFTFPVGTAVNLQACSTINVSASPTCSAGTAGCGWRTGDMRTADQNDWGDETSAAGATLIGTFNSLYSNDLVVGGTNELRFEDVSSVFVYLPTGGSAGVLTSTIVNPITTSAGQFGGEVTALKLNADHSSQFGNVVSLSDLTICGLATLPAMNGQTVRQFLTTANDILGGGSATISAGQATALAAFINTAFVNGVPSTFAQNNLQVGPCGTWQSGDMLTASQDDWGDSTTAAGASLNANFNSLYPGELVVGGTNILEFSDAGAVFSYLPATGNPGVLTNSILNPLSTSAGELGGEVTALKLNVDFSSLFGNIVPLADLTICNLATLPTMNGQTVGQFLSMANHILGGDSASISVSQTTALARLINTAFLTRTPSSFAQNNLVNGSCP